MSDLLTAANDPAFVIHHVFVDKLLEVWMEIWKPDVSEVS